MNTYRYKMLIIKNPTRVEKRNFPSGKLLYKRINIKDAVDNSLQVRMNMSE